ncbi:hypothetical protein GCWU000342_02037 [Shuttleworthella satelles DSM 14600]|uniref:Uncharacterized protein n=1 Tax=Shuttleworthella satelles DSM 14600 TaxID=626523 RepID=C4GE91_9FIRM|nr:hypothetical protein GCWU000342_02037 [Shuttleworthia satelles DSM 14600]
MSAEQGADLKKHGIYIEAGEFHLEYHLQWCEDGNWDRYRYGDCLWRNIE